MLGVNPAEALYASDKYLELLGLNRQWLHEFWFEYTPQGREADNAGDQGAWFTDIYDDDSFFLQVIKDTQSFVFGDEGDAAVGIEAAPATEGEVTGVLDAGTYIRMVTFQEFMTEPEPTLIEQPQALPLEPNDYIIVAGKQVPVEGDIQIISMGEPGGLDIVRSAKPRKGKATGKGYSKWPKPLAELAGKDKKYARLSNFVHWDAGWSAQGAFKMLIRRGLGTCMGIDRPRKEDGKVICYQWLDPGLYYGWHGSAANQRSGMSFDMSNAVYAKYASKYEELCGIPRPLLRISSKEKVGRGNPFLGMYRDQVLSLLRVMKAFALHLGMQYHWPVDKDGVFVGRNYKRLFKDDFHGVAEHRMLPSTSKWDCRGLFAQVVALLLSDDSGKLMKEFQQITETHRLHDDHWGPWLDKVKKHWEWKELWG